MSSNVWLDGVMGLIVGDALGVPVQFMYREEIATREAGLVKGMESGGIFNMPAGTWSDDGSMALATLDSIVQNKRIDLKDIMECFCSWELDGKYTQYGEAFDQGNTCTTAIYNYIQDRNVDMCGCTGESSNGNGSLMRILPACIFIALDTESSEDVKMDSIHKVSGLTHNHQRSKMAYFARLFHLDELQLLEDSEIKSSGYAIDTIEAAVWCLITTDSLKECLLKAVNLGDDTDTVAAVAGGLAGLFYGVEAIPGEWLNVMNQKEYVERLCEKANSLCSR